MAKQILLSLSYGVIDPRRLQLAMTGGSGGGGGGGGDDGGGGGDSSHQSTSSNVLRDVFGPSLDFAVSRNWLQKSELRDRRTGIAREVLTLRL